MTTTSGQNDESCPPPGRGVLGWLGRQVGYVKRAVHHDPSTLANRPTTLFRSAKVEEHALPAMPHVKLRRTTIDEVMIDADVNRGRQQNGDAST